MKLNEIKEYLEENLKGRYSYNFKELRESNIDVKYYIKLYDNYITVTEYDKFIKLFYKENFKYFTILKRKSWCIISEKSIKFNGSSFNLINLIKNYDFQRNNWLVQLYINIYKLKVNPIIFRVSNLKLWLKYYLTLDFLKKNSLDEFIEDRHGRYMFKYKDFLELICININDNLHNDHLKMISKDKFVCNFITDEIENYIAKKHPTLLHIIKDSVFKIINGDKYYPLELLKTIGLDKNYLEYVVFYYMFNKIEERIKNNTIEVKLPF